MNLRKFAFKYGEINLRKFVFNYEEMNLRKFVLDYGEMNFIKKITNQKSWKLLEIERRTKQKIKLNLADKVYRNYSNLTYR